MRTLKVDFYRSKPLVNMTEDMVRVVITMPAIEWRMIRDKIKYLIFKLQPLKERGGKS